MHRCERGIARRSERDVVEADDLEVGGNAQAEAFRGAHRPDCHDVARRKHRCGSSALRPCLGEGRIPAGQRHERPNDGVVVESKTMVDERAAVAPKTATAHPEILVELLGWCVEGQHEYFPMSAVEE